MWNFRDADFDKFRENLSEADWDSCFVDENPDIVCKKWTQLFLKISQNSINVKSVLVRPRDNPWYNNYLRRLCRQKDRIFQKSKISLSQKLTDLYKKTRNHYFTEVDRIHKDYDDQNFEMLSQGSSKNPKKWWTMTKRVTGMTSISEYPTIIENDVLYETDAEKAEIFNRAFVNICDLDESGAEIPDTQGPLSPPTEFLDQIPITEEDVMDQLKCLNIHKAYGPDEINPRLLKEGAQSIVASLTKLLRLSLQKGIFPSLWKLANVLPILKKDDPSVTLNYRPISLLCTLAKVFEHIVFKYMFNYFRQNFMITLFQAGFSQGSSTVTQLIEVYDQMCKAVNDHREIRIVFLDITKAFDRGGCSTGVSFGPITFFNFY
jgi:hypothetical protein